MKKFICFLLALSALTFTSKAEAHFTNYYYGFGGGFNWNKYNHHHFNYDQKVGFIGLINAGLNLCYDFRFEGEFTYRFNKIKHLDHHPRHFRLHNEGKNQQWGLLGNVVWDFKYYERFTPFVGAGAGYAIQKVSLSNQDIIDFKHNIRGFAWQVIAGVTFRLCPKIEMLLSYRYLRGARNNMWNNSALLSFNFWIN